MDKGSISLPTVVVGQAITVGQIIKQDYKRKRVGQTKGLVIVW